jgi:hypothetical protein
MAMGTTDDMTQVLIYTRHFRIIGWISLVAGARLTDYVREPSHFIAVAKASVLDRHGKDELFHTEFVDVGKDHIEIILPAHLAVEPGKG